MSHKSAGNSEITKLIADADDKIKKKLDKKRYLHTVSVAHTASCMAMRYGEDPYRAYLAGLLHDNAKCIPHDKKMSLCAKYGLSVSDIEQNNPDLLHAKLGSVLAEKKFGITDPEILSAITFHTTGKPGMSTLEKIIYVADYIEIRRKPLPMLGEIRKAAFTDLDGCVLLILESTLAYLKEKQAAVDSITAETYEYYKRSK